MLLLYQSPHHLKINKKKKKKTRKKKKEREEIKTPQGLKVNPINIQPMAFVAKEYHQLHPHQPHYDHGHQH